MHFVQLDDGDKICLVEMKPSKEINAGAGTGSWSKWRLPITLYPANGHAIKSGGMASLLRQLKNCGPSLGYSKTIYNAGNSSDFNSSSFVGKNQGIQTYLDFMWVFFRW